jgi:hypothetical protein
VIVAIGMTALVADTKVAAWWILPVSIACAGACTHALASGTDAKLIEHLGERAIGVRTPGGEQRE